MHVRRQAGETNAHDFDRLFKLRLQKIERNHRAVVKRRLTFTEEARRQILRGAGIGEFLRENIVVFHLNLHFRRTEGRKIPHGLFARRDMKIIAVHRRVRARDDDGIRLERRGAVHDLAISRCRLRNLLFLALSNFRQDDRRMRHGHRC